MFSPGMIIAWRGERCWCWQSWTDDDDDVAKFSVHSKTRLKTIRSQHTLLLLLLLSFYFILILLLLRPSPFATLLSFGLFVYRFRARSLSLFVALLFWFSGFCGFFFIVRYSFSSIRRELTYSCYCVYFFFFRIVPVLKTYIPFQITKVFGVLYTRAPAYSFTRLMMMVSMWFSQYWEQKIEPKIPCEEQISSIDMKFSIWANVFG